MHNAFNAPYKQRGMALASRWPFVAACKQQMAVTGCDAKRAHHCRTILVDEIPSGENGMIE
jgi:hypothetical protein